MSNACASGEFFYQTYSPEEPPPVREELINHVFMAQFSFMSKTPDFQPGLFLSVSPDSREGSRMSWVGLQDTPAGIRVIAADTPEVNGEFVYTDLALLSHTHPHTIRFWIEVNPGPDNDPVQIATDGRVHRLLHDVGELLPHRPGAGAATEHQYASEHQQPAVPLQRAGAPCPRP